MFQQQKQFFNNLHITLIFSNFIQNYKHLKIIKKSESISRKETPEEELKRLRKENQSLKSYLEKVNKQYGQIKDKLKASKDKLKAEKTALKAELKKRRHEDNLEQRAERITFDVVPRH